MHEIVKSALSLIDFALYPPTFKEISLSGKQYKIFYPINIASQLLRLIDSLYIKPAEDNDYLNTLCKRSSLLRPDNVGYF